jgi:hypothetical protein
MCVCVCVCVYLKVTIHLKREAYISPGADVYAKTGSGPPMTNFDMSSLGKPLFDMSRPLRNPRPIDGGFGLVAPTTSFANTMPQGTPSLHLSPLFRALALAHSFSLPISLSNTHTHTSISLTHTHKHTTYHLAVTKRDFGSDFCEYAGLQGGPEE